MHRSQLLPAHAPPGLGPLTTGPSLFGLALWCCAEAGNARCHKALAELRPPVAAAGPSSRLYLPTSAEFSLVSFPHYLCEILSWVGFNFVLGCAAATY